MSNRKRIKQPAVPTAEETVDQMAREFAKHMFDKATREHEAEMKREAERQAARLADNDYVASFGLPTDLPEHTRKILGVTMTADRLGPMRPQRDKVYRRYGVGD
jgi:hypothetical protein